MSSTYVTDIDRGFRHVDRQSKKDGYVDVGYWNGENKSQENALIDLVEIAWQNEFGTKNIPERSFLRSTIQENRETILVFINRGIKRILTGRESYNTFVKKLGLLVVTMVKKKITNSPSWATPNAPATIAQKGSSKPLINTGQMRNEVDYKEVVK